LSERPAAGLRRLVVLGRPAVEDRLRVAPLRLVEVERDDVDRLDFAPVDLEPPDLEPPDLVAICFLLTSGVGGQL